MKFIHQDLGFADLVEIVSAKRQLGRGLVEKDYWVTHALWALEHQGFEFWFKGGTSLSKGFGLIERFSEDIDLKVEPGRVAGLPVVTNWKSEGSKATAARRAFFEALAARLRVPDGRIVLDGNASESAWRGAELRIEYPGLFLDELGGILRPFVLLEVGSARVTPFVERSAPSFVHDELAAQGQLKDFRDNRPMAVRCVHPLVTLVEKLDAITRRFPRETLAAASFVRHYEDAANIIRARAALPPLVGYVDAVELAAEMASEKQIVGVPGADAPAFALAHDERTKDLRNAYAAMDPMYWGARLTLDDACAEIRAWISQTWSE